MKIAAGFFYNLTSKALTTQVRWCTLAHAFYQNIPKSLNRWSAKIVINQKRMPNIFEFVIMHI